MNLLKINEILTLFLQLNVDEQKALLNLLAPTPKPKDIPPPRVQEILEEIRKASEKTKDSINPIHLPVVPHRSYPPYVKKGDPFYPTIRY